MLENRDIKEFKKIVGEENFFSDEAHLQAYCYDATRDRYKPEAVIFPRDERDVIDSNVHIQRV